MNDEELKHLWQQQPLREPEFSAEQLISAMQNKMSEFRRTLLWRNVRELGACVVLIIIFGFYFFHQRAPIARLGDLIVIGGCIFIACRLLYASRTTRPAPPGASIVESVQAELNAMRTQSRLLKSVFWWYLLPLTIGELVFVWGDLDFTNRASLIVMIPTNIIVTLVILAVNVFVYWLNQWARREQLVPAEAQLEALLHSVKTGEPMPETQSAYLRPIALSMAAASQVKPVEFKVAFWQLALYGEIGFIGMWFFLIFGLAMNNPGGKAEEPAQKPAALVVHIEATNREAVVAPKIINLLNAGDYSTVQELYNADMIKVFPSKKTSEFYTGLAESFGKIERIEGPTGDGYEGWTAFHLDCQRGKLVMSLALDDDGKIAGIYFKPAASRLNIKSMVSQYFTPLHLFWLGLFFLAGLLYSRIIQNTTKRAVGISTLGIHLRKGQILILWDEIKEVRTLRVLNFRNLWLVRESGEKTIMHWTPLERHSDVKAAIESFAPANHPIRQYLPLLKRVRTK